MAKPKDDDEFVGPLRSQFDDWTPEKKAAVDSVLEKVDGVKLYKQAGGYGVGSQFRDTAIDLHRSGGLTQEQADTLARYKIYKEGRMVPEARAPEETQASIAARADAIKNAKDDAERARLWDENRQQVKFHAGEALYDDLVRKDLPKPAEPPPTNVSSVTPEGIDKARELLKKRKKMV